jgi:hypothetical protein
MTRRPDEALRVIERLKQEERERNIRREEEAGRFDHRPMPREFLPDDEAAAPAAVDLFPAR